MASDRRRQYLRLDRWGIFDVARDYRLSSTEAWLLGVVVMLADIRSPQWIGPISELAGYARCSRNTATKVVQRLTELGLLEVPTPFRSGGSGTIVVPDEIYGRLVVGDGRSAPTGAAKSAQICANDEVAKRGESAQISADSSAEDCNRSDTGLRPVWHGSAQIKAIDQGEQGASWDRGSKGGWDGDAHREECVPEPAPPLAESIFDERVCVTCGDPFRATGPGPDQCSACSSSRRLPAAPAKTAPAPRRRRHA